MGNDGGGARGGKAAADGLFFGKWIEDGKKGDGDQGDG